jgi:aminomethyltransferase
MEIKKIPLHHIHVALNAKIVPFAGYDMPVRYSSDIEEHMAVRNNVGMFDVSHMGEFLVEGSGSLELIQAVTSNDASVLTDGRVQYSCFTNGDGGIIDDLLVYRITADKYMLVVNASNIDKDWNWVSSKNSFGAKLTNISDQTCLFAIQGPAAIQVLQPLTGLALNNMPYYHFAVGEFAGIKDVTISNTGYTGAGGFEIYVPNDKAEHVWNAIMEAGQSVEIKPIGLGARDTLRLEMGFCLYGNDITDETSPLEAGLGWITKFTKSFTASEKLIAQKAAGVSRKLVGFTMIDRGIPRGHYTLHDAEGHAIGEVTSGTQSPVLGVGIGMGYVQLPWANVGSEIYVDVRGRKLKASVTKLPFVPSQVL